MDEELGVKGTVTRLRRRLSVEADGAQSPATPSTPTKKRATRLAKPALELIDENVTESVPKKTTRKSIARDVATEAVEEKAVTPSRRSARIRSNTSLILETNPIAVDSPRARRAIRRTSQLGSDTESTTPAKPTRRTRRDSASSVEKIAVTNPNEKLIAQVAEIIVEEPEKELSKNSKVDITDQSPSPTLRKSPRLNKKGNKSIDETVNSIKEKKDEQAKTLDDGTKNNNETATNVSKTEKALLNTNEKTDSKLEPKASVKGNLSVTSANLINEIGSYPKRSSLLNKTTSVIEELTNEKTNIKRTKSWTTLTSSPSREGKVNDTNMNKDSNLNSSSSASGDGLMNKNEIKSPNISMNKLTLPSNTSTENIHNIMKSLHELDTNETAKLLEKAPSKDIQSLVFIEDSDSNSGSIGKLTIDLKNEGECQHSKGDDQCVPVIKQATPKRSSASESFSVEPMDIDETIPENVTINDYSDKSNSSREESKMLFESKRKSSISNENKMNMKESPNKSKRTSSISLQQESNTSKRKSSIGESKENIDFKAALNKSDSFSNRSQRKSSTSMQNDNNGQPNEHTNKSKRKSSLSKVDSENDKRKSSVSSQFEDNDKINESVNQSKRKSGTDGELQNLEKTSNENKSTLVLSQLKDISANEISNVTKSANDTNNDLSKSLNIPTKGTDKKNMSLTYLTSTPLQQKSLQKIAMQINTSIISPNAGSKNTSKVDKTTPKKIESNEIHNSDSSDDESDDDSKENSKLIDNEAEEASENYESGDSRDEEERQYEEDHEIVQKGETLDSSEEFSNDSDYEKDSFIASSDEEDNDLLSGSGDDLSLSDNELKMTTKSKKKFDERKRKEQKKASKEMYEARHELNESAKSAKSKTKKTTHQQLDSSLLESDKEDEIQPKKKNRCRIDSSQDISLNNSNGDESICIKKKKTKRLSESVCEENVDPDEKEITIFNKTVAKNDPLSVAVKQEPKTPQKDLNISTVLITDNIEEVQVDGNTSVMKVNETSDPLQATLAHDNEEESDSTISENMEIKENYDSVLENLSQLNNKEKKVKTLDISLNLNKKTKDIVKEPIIDQLNLTQVKKSKKNKSQLIEESEISEEPTKPLKEKDVSVIQIDEGETSDSIDMRLLFPEDSNDSETNDVHYKLNEKQDLDTADPFIPLKRSEAKTNIHESMEPDGVSSSNANFGFFFDTKGTYEDMETSTQSSAKKRKHKQNLSVDATSDVVWNETATNIPVLEESLVNVSLKSDKKKKKNKSHDFSQILDKTGEETNDTRIEVSFRTEKHNKSNTAVPEELQVNVSVKSDKKKKKNKSFDVSQIVDNMGEAADEVILDVSSKSEKKRKNNKNKSLDGSQVVDNTGEAADEVILDVSSKSEKKRKNNKNKSLDGSQIVDNTGEAPIDVNLDVSSNSKKKKNKNKSLDGSQMVDDMGEATDKVILDDSSKSEKKKKNSKNKSLDGSRIFDITGEAPNEVILDASSNSEKKKKKKKNKSLDVSQIVDNTEFSDEAPNEVILDASSNSEKKKKKNKKNKSLDSSATVDNTATEETLVNDVQVKSDKKKKKKKKKNKSLDGSQLVDKTGEESDEAPIEVSYKSEKIDKSVVSDLDASAATGSKNKFKKNKKKKNIDEQQTAVNTVNTQEGVVNSKKRKRDATSALAAEAVDGGTKMSKNEKKRKIAQNSEPLTEDVAETKSKKRKAQDDGQNNTKVFKQNSVDNIHVPRLPESIVNQLDDKSPKKNIPKESKKQKKAKAISTMPFEVEVGKNRKNKPSNYLEQSIYLNDSPVKAKKKGSIKNPKVLPFVPTAITSEKGYTSNFRINVLPEDTQFVAQASDIPNFKNEYLSKQRIKKLGTFERFKKQRNQKLSKF